MIETPASSSNKLVPVLVVLLIGASFLLGALYTRVNLLEKGLATGTPAQVAGAGTAQNPPRPTPGPVDIDVTGAPVLGNAQARVAIVEFTDYQCPYCKQLFSNTFPQIKKDYIDTGKIKYIVRDFPLSQIHPQAQKAAEAAHCAEDQGKFWEYHDLLFQNQQALQVEDLKNYATQVGLNANLFNSCLDSNKFADKIQKDLSAGQTHGVTGTPSSFVGVIDGDTVKQAVNVSGAVPFDVFKTTIDEVLKKV